jgi:hypothetical protein
VMRFGEILSFLHVMASTNLMQLIMLR